MSSVHHLTADPRDSARLAYGLSIRAAALGNGDDIPEAARSYIQELSSDFQTLFGNFALQPGVGRPGSIAWLQEVLNQLRQDDKTFPIFENEDRIVNADAAMAYAMLRIRSSVLYETNPQNTDLKNHLYLMGQSGQENLHLADARETDLERGGQAAAAEAAASKRYREMYDTVNPDPDVERGFRSEEAGRSRKLSFKDMVAQMDSYESQMKSGSLHHDSRLYRNITDALKKISDNWEKDPAENIDEMISAYKELDYACRQYIQQRKGASSKLGQQRLSIIAGILHTERQEQIALTLYKNRMQQGNLPEEGKKPTLLDVATEARFVRIPANAPRVGGAMSSRIQIQEGPDKGFFTENKPFGKSMKEDYLRRLHAEPGIPDEIKDAITLKLAGAELFEEIEYMQSGDEFMDFLHRHAFLGPNAAPAEKAAWQGMANDVDSYLSGRVPRVMTRAKMEEIINRNTNVPEAGRKRLFDAVQADKRCNNLHMPTSIAGPQFNILSYIPEALKGNEDLEKTCLEFQDRCHKQAANEYGTQRMAGVPSESLSRLNDRSIATSVLAGLLGCPDVVAQAQKARAGTGENAVDGILMETANGRSGSRLRMRHQIDGWKVSGCSPNVKRQLADLQILDLLCGQCDRHRDNIIWESDNTTYPISIKGIDHDMSFGVFDVETRGFHSSHLGLVRVVDQRTYDFMQNLAKPENRTLIEYKFKDLLSEKEINALWGRIDTVAQWLKQDSVKKVQPEEWGDLAWKDLVLKGKDLSDGSIFVTAHAYPENIFSRVVPALFVNPREEMPATDRAQRMYEEGIRFEKNLRMQRELSARNARNLRAAQNQTPQNRAVQDPQPQNQDRVIRSGP